jgi:serine/threonine-protein kinase HipA
MKRDKKDVFVYADWIGFEKPTLVGILNYQGIKGHSSFSFEYDTEWLEQGQYRHLDPELLFFGGVQYPADKEIFGIFSDSMPDTWGRTLLKRREIQRAKERKEQPQVLHDIDYLLGVHDLSRMGGLRFKTDPTGEFLDDNPYFPMPPYSSLSELQQAAKSYEEDAGQDKIKKWLNLLIAPGASLGGARPKANIIGKDHHLWIAKFPSKADAIDKAAWEFLAYQLAVRCKIEMAESQIVLLSNSSHRTFLTKRFDRLAEKRIHFASAMTLTGNNETTLKIREASYLDLVDIIETYGVDVEVNLNQLWRRIIFNITISNTDDHLRNHGFILEKRGWRLSPAYDLNPSIDKGGLALNINNVDNRLDFTLAMSVGPYFRLDKKDMLQIIQEVTETVNQWKELAKEIGIPRSEILLMEPAFNIKFSAKL